MPPSAPWHLLTYFNLVSELFDKSEKLKPIIFIDRFAPKEAKCMLRRTIIYHLKAVLEYWRDAIRPELPVKLP